MNRLLLSAGIFCVAASSMATMFFNSSNQSNNATTRSNFLAAAGVANGEFIQDFESFDLGTNMIGVDIGGGVTIQNSGSGVVDIRGAGAFGGSNPIGDKGLWHNESQYLELMSTITSIELEPIAKLPFRSSLDFP